MLGRHFLRHQLGQFRSVEQAWHVYCGISLCSLSNSSFKVDGDTGAWYPLHRIRIDDKHRRRMCQVHALLVA